MDERKNVIYVNVGGYLAFYLPGRLRTMTIEAGAGLTIADVILAAGIPPHEIALMVLNGEHVTAAETAVKSGDAVGFYSASDGG